MIRRLTSWSDARSPSEKSRAPGDVLGQLHQLATIAEAAGIDPDCGEIRTIRWLIERGKSDLAAKLQQPLIARATDRLFRPVPFPLKPLPAQQGIALGQATDGCQLGDPVVLPLAVVPEHIGIFGRSGTGKSVFVQELVVQLIEHGGLAWVFDVDGEYIRIVERLGVDRVWLVRPEWLRINPFEARGDPGRWIASITSLLRQVWFMRDGGTTQASRVLHDLYEQAGCFNGSGRWPSLGDVWTTLGRLRFSQTSQTAGHLETLMRVIRGLLDRFGQLFDCVAGMAMDQFTSRSVIWDVRQFDSQELEFFICVLLLLTEQDEPQETPLAIVIDESHRVFNKIRHVRQDLGEPPLEERVRRLRKQRKAIVVVDQAPSLSPDSLIANLGTRVSFALTNQPCARRVQGMLALTDEQASILPTLPPRVAIVTASGVGGPILMRIPDVSVTTRIDRSRVEDEMRQIVSRLSYRPSRHEQENREAAGSEARERPREQENVRLNRPERENEQKRTSIDIRKNGQSERHEKNNANDRSASRAERTLFDTSSERHENDANITTSDNAQSTQNGVIDGHLSLEALRYLEASVSAENVLLPVTQLDRAQGLSLAKGSQLRTVLERERLIDLEEIRTGRRGGNVKVIVLTEKGRKLLERLHVRVHEPEGKGSTASTFWSHAIQRFVRKDGRATRTRIEWMLNGKACDVGVQRADNEGIVAYEVCLSTGNVTANVLKNLEAGFAKVVLCGLTEKELTDMKKRLARELGDETWRTLGAKGQVSFQLLATFLER